MSEEAPVLQIHRPSGQAAPVVFDSPHSGTHVPDDAGAQVDLRRLGIGVDRLVDQLFADAPAYGAVLITAGFARAYIDPNRNEADLDPDLLAEPWPEPLRQTGNVRHGKGLVWRYTGRGEEIYGRRLSVAEVRRRIYRYWRPYHDAVSAHLDELHGRFGAVWHVNCHSMRAVGNRRQPDPGSARPDFTVSDREGRTCDDAFLACVVDGLAGMGYEVAVNHPYRGMELIRRYGDPTRGRHSLQIEVNRRLYLDERSGRPHDGWAGLRADLGRLIGRVCAHARAASAVADG
jgi:N-formylglutamate amidohydrolase